MRYQEGSHKSIMTREGGEAVVDASHHQLDPPPPPKLLLPCQIGHITQDDTWLPAIDF